MKRRLLSLALCLMMLLSMLPTDVVWAEPNLEYSAEGSSGAPDPTATPKPEPTATPKPEPTATAESVVTATAEPVVTATAEPDPTDAPLIDPTATAEPDPTVTAEPDPTDDPSIDPTTTPEVDPSETPEAEETPAPEEEETEEPEVEETPAPEEALKFTFTDDTMELEAYADPEAGLSSDAKLRVKKLDKDSDDYRRAYEKALAAVELPENAILEFVPYDVYFEDGGARIEPSDGFVRIRMRFTKPVFEAEIQRQLIASIASFNSRSNVNAIPALEEGPVFAIHITEKDEVQQLKNKSEKESELVFDVDSFSVMGPARVSMVMPVAEGEETLNAYLYSDGELVIVFGDAPDADRTLSHAYTDIGTYTTYTNVPWYGQRTSIQTVTFKTNDAGQKVQPASMAYWFYTCTALTSVNREGLDTSNTTSFSNLFYGCSKLPEIDLSGLSTEKISNVSYMFESCSALVSANLSGWTLPNLSGLSYMFRYCSKLESLDLSYWSPSRLTSYSGTFWGCSKLANLNMSNWTVLGTTNIKNDTNMFYSGHGLVNVNMSNWNTSGSTAASVGLGSFFSEHTKLVSVDMSGWDSYDKITSLGTAFYKCSSLQEWKLSENATFENVTSLASAFYGCSSLKSLDTSNWKLDKLTSMSNAFYGCTALNGLDTSNWNPTNLTTMSNAFYDCASLESLDMSGWTMENLTSMSYAFFNCKGLTQLNTSGWSMAQVANMDYAFYSCYALEEIDASNWNTAAVTNMSNAFNPGPARLVLGPDFVFGGSENAFGATLWLHEETGEVYTYEELFSSYLDLCPAGTYIHQESTLPGGWVFVVLYEDGELVFQHSIEVDTERERVGMWRVDTSYAYTTALLPWYDYRTSVTKITFADRIQPIRMDYWFYGMTNAKLDNSEVFYSDNLDTSHLTSLRYTFANTTNYSATSWRNVDLSNWNLDNLTDLSNAFYGSTYVESVNFGEATLSKVTTMAYMFYGGSTYSSTSLKTLDTSHWDLSNVTNMYYAFRGCSSLTELAGDWNLSAVTNLSYAFYNCSKLQTLNTSSWDLSNVTTLYYAFYNCSSLTELDTSNWNLSSITSTGMSYAFYGCKKLKTIDASGWDLSKVTSLAYAFYNCSSLTQLDTSNWGINATVTYFSMDHAFYGTGGLEVLDMSGWNNRVMTGSMASAFHPAPKKLILGENFHFIATGEPPIASVTYQRESTLELYTAEELYTTYDGATMADTYFLYANDPSGYFFVLLYDDGDLVFQYTGEPDPNRTLVTSYFYDVSTQPTISGLSTANPSCNVPWFSNRARVKKVTFADPIEPLYMDGWFMGMTGLDGRCFANAGNLNTAKTRSMSYMFYGCTGLTQLQIGGWDTRSLTDLTYTFRDCTKLTNVDMSGWDMSHVTTLKYTFFSCSGLVNLNTFGWNLSSVKDMDSTFYSCSRLASLDTANWDLDGVTNMFRTFYGCSSLTGLETSGWTLPNVTTLGSAFYGCSLLTVLDTSNWTMASNTTLASTFYNCKSLKSLDTSKWQLGNVTTMASAFSGCTGLSTLDVRQWDTHSVTSMVSAFSGCGGLTSLDVSGWDVSAVTSMASMFLNCSGLTTLPVEDWRPAKVSSFEKTFSGCTGLTSLPAQDWELSAATTISSMFDSCSALVSVGATNWGLEKLTNASNAFNKCSALSDIDTSGWHMPKVTNISYMFGSCSSLTELAAGGWGFDSVSTAAYAFSGCSSLRTLGEGSWNLTKPTALTYLLYNCNSLVELDVSNWRSSGVTTTPASVGSLPSLWKVTLWNDPSGTKNILSLGDESTYWFEEGHPGEEEYTFTPNQMRERNLNPELAGRTYYRICRVNFDANGGTVDGAQYVEGWYAGTPLDELPNATRRGYDFDGWYTKPVGGDKIEAGQELWQTTFYAHWIEHHYTLVLLANDTSDREERFELGFSEFFDLSSTAFFTREFYELESWNTRADGSGTRYGANETVLQLTGDDNGFVYLYAQWEDVANMVTVTFETDGGVEVSPIRVKRNTAIGKLPITAKDGYTFMDWHLESLFGEIVTEDTIIRGDVTLVAEYQAHRTVRFVLNRSGSSEMEAPMWTRQVPYNTALGTLPSDPANGSYGVLIGWFTARVGGTQIFPNTPITSDMTLYGHWGWRPKFNANGGTLVTNPDLPIQSSAMYTITEFPEVERDGYVLVGWVLSDGVTPVQIGDTVDLARGAELIAIWERSNTVNLLLDPNGGTLKGSTKPYMMEVYEGIPVTELPTPTRNGYEFLGWVNADDPDGGYLDRDSVFTEDMTLIA